MPEHNKATGQYRGLDMKCPQAHLFGSKLQLLSWEDLGARSRSLRSVALKVMPGPNSPPHHLLSFCP